MTFSCTVAQFPGLYQNGRGEIKIGTIPIPEDRRTRVCLFEILAVSYMVMSKKDQEEFIAKALKTLTYLEDRVMTPEVTVHISIFIARLIVEGHGAFA